jgi:4-hydroxy-2-oxoheptanedioate aldolase
VEPASGAGELLAGTGAEYVVLDLQRGALTEADLRGVTAAIVAAGAVPLVRTRGAQFADVGRPLNLSAHGCSCRTCAAPTTSARSSPPAGTRRLGRGRSDVCPEALPSPRRR